MMHHELFAADMMLARNKTLWAIYQWNIFSTAPPSPHKYQVPLKALPLLAGASLEVKKLPQN